MLVCCVYVCVGGGGGGGGGGEGRGRRSGREGDMCSEVIDGREIATVIIKHTLPALLE